MVMISGTADVPMDAAEADPPADSKVDPKAEAQMEAQMEAQAEQAINDWLRRTIRPGIRLVTICSGALLAGRAGLLDGHRCTTHHAAIAELRWLAPRALILENRLHAEEGERLSSAGIDLMLALVAREAGHRVALAVARYLVVYLHRGGGDPQLSPWLEGRNHLYPAIHHAQDAVAADPARAWPVAQLAGIAATSPRNLSRLFNHHVGMSVTDYMNRVRVALARELVIGSRLGMEQVAERAGFASPRQLRRAWNRLNDAPPSRLREERAGRGSRADGRGGLIFQRLPASAGARVRPRDAIPQRRSRLWKNCPRRAICWRGFEKTRLIIASREKAPPQ